jgi:hypothetical protein
MNDVVTALTEAYEALIRQTVKHLASVATMMHPIGITSTAAAPLLITLQYASLDLPPERRCQIIIVASAHS